MPKPQKTDKRNSNKAYNVNTNANNDVEQNLHDIKENAIKSMRKYTTLD